MILTDYPEIMKEIRESDTLRKRWEKYSREYEYAKDISFDDTCNSIQKMMNEIMAWFPAMTSCKKIMQLILRNEYEPYC